MDGGAVRGRAAVGGGDGSVDGTALGKYVVGGTEGLILGNIIGVTGRAGLGIRDGDAVGEGTEGIPVGDGEGIGGIILGGNDVGRVVGEKSRINRWCSVWPRWCWCICRGWWL